ncbi:MAG: RagB/SusD family nutrient uptake outer membrane protein [Bacteroidales bacterium]|jgi:hypothetical protein
MRLFNNIIQITLIILLVGLSFQSCTDLQEDVLDETSGEDILKDPANIPSIVGPVYAALRDLWWRQSFWGLQETTSDECMFPTRGTDWWDTGVWVQAHLHTWTPTHRDISDTWNRISKGLGRANYALLLLDDFPETEEIRLYKAELKFFRAFYSYCYMDLWGKVPYREYTETEFTKNPQILDRPEAFEYIVEEVEAVMPELGDKYEVPYGRINKDVARMLLAKLYINKEVYTGTPGWTECVQYCNELINSGRYGLADDYFDIFSVENDQFFTDNDEAIFVSIMDDNQEIGVDDNVQWVNPTLHYFQTLGGNYSPWNGCVAPESFFNKIDTANDLRYQDDRIKATTGADLGFLIGQQYDENGDSLFTRQNEPLVYTPECPLSGANEAQGVRVLKYEPKVPPIHNARTDNDFVIWRIADTYLMRAEAQFRINGGGLDDLNAVRVQRGLDPLGSITEQAIIDERGFELYWEGHRRQDLIRFGMFTDAWTEKPVTEETKELFPIPQKALDAYNDESLISQNPGYN